MQSLVNKTERSPKMEKLPNEYFQNFGSLRTSMQNNKPVIKNEIENTIANIKVRNIILVNVQIATLELPDIFRT